MAFSTFVFLTLLKMALSLPDPDPNVKVGVDVKVDDQGSNCCNNKKTDCCPPPTCLGCNFGMTSYPDKAFLKDSCFMMQCKDGAWDFTGEFDPSCGKCEAWGEPHFLTFDLHTNNPFGFASSYYNFQGQGQFVMTQEGLGALSDFGVKSTFVPCADGTITCIQSVTYYEPGIEIKLSLPTPECHGSSCKIEVNGMKITEKPYYFLGTVLIFEDNYITLPSGDQYDYPLHCINIVGSRGLSVSLCSVVQDYGLLHIRAQPSLKNQLFGLCDTYNGTTHDFYTARNGSHEEEIEPIFADSWQDGFILPYSTPVSVDKCANETVLNEIQQKCNNLTHDKCEHVKMWHCEALKAACVFDLCHYPDPKKYIHGLVRHEKACPWT